MSGFADAAIAYALRLGWAVLPVVRKGKEPLTSHGLLDATKDATKIKEWGERWPDANVGIRTGLPSMIIVLDVDPRHGGHVTLEEIESQHGPLPHTVESITGGGGRHILFGHLGGQINSGANILGSGLDLRADGAYIVAPPSTHQNGSRYVWEGAHRPLETAIAAPPAWLLERFQATSKSANVVLAEVDWRTLVGQGIGEGARNDALARLAGRWLRRHLDPFEVLEVAMCWNRQRCRPPLADEEVVRIVNSIAAKEMTRRKEGAA